MGEIVLQSSWDPQTAGGCLNYPTWRNNRQYLIEITGPCTLVLTLERISQSVTTPLGLYIFDYKESFGGRVLDVSAHRTVYKAFKRSQLVKCQIEVVPDTTDHVTRWVLMPCTFEPNHCAPFTLRGHVIDQGTVSARISQLSEISSAELSTITVKGQWTAQTSGGSILSPQFYRNPQYRIISDGEVHVTLLQPRTDFEDLIGLYLATLKPTGVNRWSAPTLLDDASVTRVTAENYDATVVSMSDFSLNTEAHALVDGCTNKEMIVVPATAQSGTTSSFELQFTHTRNTHVTVHSVNDVHYRHRHSAGHVINRWQYLLVPDVTKNRTERTEFDVSVSIDLPNLDRPSSDDYGFYLLKAPKSLRVEDELNLAQSKIGQRFSTRAAVSHTVRVTVDTNDMWLIIPYASLTCAIDVSVTALHSDQTFIFRPQLEYCHQRLSDTWCHLAAGADVSDPLFNLYEHFTLTLDEISQQQADGSRDLIDANHVLDLVLTSALPDLEVGLALIPWQSRDRLSDVRSAVLTTKYGKGTATLKIARERMPEIDFCLGDCDKITVIPLVRHSSGGDFTLTAVSSSSTCHVNISKVTQRNLTAVKGKWQKETAGGGLDHVTWRNNPHYLLKFPLKANKSIQTTLMLIQRADKSAKHVNESIGLCSYAVNSSLPLGAKKRFLLTSRDHLIPPPLSSEHSDLIMHHVNLDPLQDYVIVPFTEFPNLELDYELIISSSEHVTLDDMTRAARDYWHSVQFTAAWTSTCSGGARESRDNSWMQNPWCLVHVSQPGPCTVLLQQSADSDLTLHHIGFDILRVNDASAPMTGGEIVISCEYKRAREVGVELKIDRANEWWYIVPSTLQPGLLAKFVLTVHCASPVIIHRDHLAVTGVNTNVARNHVTRSGSSEKYHHVIDEILQTERSYVNSLQTVIERFMNPLLTASHVISVTDVKRLFSNLPVLLNINQQLFTELQSERDLRPSAPRLGHVFSKFSEYLKVYADYCNEFETAAELLKEFMKQKQFKEFIDKCAGQPSVGGSPGRLSLADYLIMPVQRIPRYVLLLEELTKSGNSVSYDDELLSAAQKIKHTADLINEKKRQRDSNYVVLQIQQLLVYGEGDSKTRQQVSITAPHRTYKTEGALFFINAQKQQVACHVFLFNDMLLITKPRKTSSGKLQYELKKQFALADCTLEPNLSATRFALTIANKTYVLQASSEKQKQEWTINISTLITAELQRELQTMQHRVLVQQRSAHSSRSSSLEKEKRK